MHEPPTTSPTGPDDLGPDSTGRAAQSGAASIAVIPAFECEGTIGEVVRGVLRHLDEVIVVDDGSTDATGRVAAEAGALVDRLEVNQGKGAALRRGIELALNRGPGAVALLDGDGQHDPDDLPALIGAWERGEGDLVIGCRLEAVEAIPSARYWTNYIGTRILSWMTGLELEDSQSGYRVLSAELLRDLRLRSQGYAIESEMLIKAGARRARLAHVRVRTIYDHAGGSHYRPVLDTVRISCAAVYYKVFSDD